MGDATKSELRAWARSLERVRSTESDLVRRWLAEWLKSRSEHTVLVFLPMDGEIDLEPLVGVFPGRRWLTTRTPDSGWLSVHAIDAPRETHRYGFAQPVDGAEEVDPGEVELVLTPGVAFDRSGGRLGHGAGYYDQLFSRMDPHVTKVGVTLERFVVAQVPMEPSDVSMDWLATEKGVRRTSRGSVGCPSP